MKGKSGLNNNLIAVEGIGPSEDPSVIQLTQKKMDELKIFKSQTVLLKGKKGKETISICLPDKTNRLTDDKISIGKIARSNLHIELGDIVIVEKSQTIPIGYKVNISFLEDTIREITGDLYKKILIPYFKDSYRPVHIGDIYRFSNVEFKILQTDPEKCCIVGPETLIDICEPIKNIKEEKQTNKDNIKKNDELTQKIKQLTNELEIEKKRIKC